MAEKKETEVTSERPEFSRSEVKEIIAMMARELRKPVDEQGLPDGHAARMRELSTMRDRPPQKQKRIPFVSPRGARFVAVVEEKSDSPSGRIVDLEQYTLPDGVKRSVDEGGLVPRGMNITKPDGQLTVEYKYWLTWTFWIPDKNAYVGQPGSIFADQLAALQQAASALSSGT